MQKKLIATSNRILIYQLRMDLLNIPKQHKKN